MTDDVASLRDLGDSVERAVESGDGETVMRLLGRWKECMLAVRQSGRQTDATLEEIAGDCIARNERWIAIASQGQQKRLQELDKTGQIRRKRGMVHRMYSTSTVSDSHIAGRG